MKAASYIMMNVVGLSESALEAGHAWGGSLQSGAKNGANGPSYPIENILKNP